VREGTVDPVASEVFAIGKENGGAAIQVAPIDVTGKNRAWIDVTLSLARYR
jgi:hypothetical protein